MLRSTPISWPKPAGRISGPSSQKDAERKREREQQQILRDAERKQKEKAKGLADIAKLPAAQHEAKLAELAKRIGEDISTLRDEFVEFVGTVDSAVAAPTDWDIEPWGEPVATVFVLEELIARINRHIKAEPQQRLSRQAGLRAFSGSRSSHPLTRDDEEEQSVAAQEEERMRGSEGVS
jgi:hypothetical protein